MSILSKRERRHRLTRLLVLCLACSLLLGQLIMAPPAHAAGIGIFVDGTQLKTDVAPFIQNGRVMVPFRALFEALGATVDWDGERRAVTGSRSGREVRLTIGSNTAYVNNAPQALDVPAAIVGGSTFVPLRFVGEALGATVQWDGANSAVRITLSSTASNTSGPSASVPASKIITVKDFYGNTVLVPSPAKRIVSCNIYVSQVLLILGTDPDTIVGQSNSSGAYPPLLQSKQEVGSMYSPNAEKIISLKPDVVFVTGTSATPQPAIDQLKRSGIKVLKVDCFRMDHMLYDINLVAKIVGREDAANVFINDYWLKYLNLVADRVKDIPAGKRPRVFVEQMRDYSTVSNGNINGQIVAAAGGRNIANELLKFTGSASAGYVVSPEWLLAQNPDVIFRGSPSGVSSGYGQSASGLKSVHDNIMQRREGPHLSAVKTGKVYVASGQISAGAFVPIGVLYLAKTFYPDLFQDLDPAAIHGEWLSKFYGLPYNGAWFYPEP